MLKHTSSYLLAGLLLLTSTFAVSDDAVVVNGIALDETTIMQLEAAYVTQLLAGRYWYDPHSGTWGYEGGPVAGQIAPYLALGGPLAVNASGGGTYVFVNGRELHPVDVQRLIAIFGSVQPGRYWMNAQGIGGYVGGPAIFNLYAAAASHSGGGSGYNRNTAGGGLMSDGACSGYLHPGGATVMTGDC